MSEARSRVIHLETSNAVAFHFVMRAGHQWYVLEYQDRNGKDQDLQIPGEALSAIRELLRHEDSVAKNPLRSVNTHKDRRLNPEKVRRAIEALVTCIESGDIDGSDLVAMEDARAVLNQFDED